MKPTTNYFLYFCLQHKTTLCNGSSYPIVGFRGKAIVLLNLSIVLLNDVLPA